MSERDSLSFRDTQHSCQGNYEELHKNAQEMLHCLESEIFILATPYVKVAFIQSIKKTYCNNGPAKFLFKGLNATLVHLTMHWIGGIHIHLHGVGDSYFVFRLAT